MQAVVELSLSLRRAHEWAKKSHKLADALAEVLLAARAADQLQEEFMVQALRHLHSEMSHNLDQVRLINAIKAISRRWEEEILRDNATRYIPTGG